MKQKNRWFFLLIFIAALLLAPFIMDSLNFLIIEPIAYYWWGIKRVISAFPQTIYWLILVICLGVIALFYLLKALLTRRQEVVSRKDKIGPLETLADTIALIERSQYFRWLISNRLANLTLDILTKDPGVELGRRKTKSTFLSELDWDPPENIAQYLNAGLNASISNFQGNQLFNGIKQGHQPLDINIQDVLDYLETITEQ